MSREFEAFNIAQKAIVVRNGKVLLLKGPNESGEIIWEPAGGRVEEGETLNDAFAREIFEETGVRDFEVKKLLWLNIPPFKPGKLRILIAFYLVDFKDAEIKISDEHTEFAWVDIDKIDDIVGENERLIRGVKEALEEV